MKSGVPWEVTGVRQRARETAREAARRAGLSVGEWLDAAILDSARGDGVEAAARMHADEEERHYPDVDTPPVRRRYSEYDERHRRVPDEALAEVTERLETLSRQFEQGQPSVGEDELAAIKDRIETLSRRYEQNQPRVGKGEFAAVNDRLDTLARQLDQLAYASAQIAQGAVNGERDDETSRQIASAISKLDQRLDQLIAEGRSTASEIERRVSAVDLAVAHLNREPPRQASPVGPATPLEQALVEIAERQRSLDGEATLPRADLPRAPTQGFDDLERQLRSINARIETLKPCGIENAVDTLRDDLAEIGLMIKEAMPRQAVEALETEVRALTERIDDTRHAGADGPAIAGVERGLAEVRDALRSLTPAENLVGVDEAVRALAQKIDGIAVNSQDPAAIGQLESAIANLRSVVSHVASNDALATLSAEVRNLAGKFEHVASPDILAALEQRIAIIADALAAGHKGGQESRDLQTVVQGLTDKLERLQLTRGDQTAVSALEDRIAKLVEKLDTSDARLGHLESIERGLAELLIHIEHQRAPQPIVAAAAPEVGALKRDVQRTQDSIEAVHGTLGHLVDRLAMIESGIRNVGAIGLPKAANIEPADPEAPTAPPATKAEAPKYETPEPPPVFVPALALPEPPAAPPTAPLPPMPAPVSVPAVALGNPAPATERQPIDPDLPPDHPIEPGATKRRNGSPADRIAASEAALGPAKPPVIPDPGGKSNFIAAARRAAQAAGAEPPARAGKDSARAVAASTSPWGPRVRSFLVAASVVAIIVGSFQLLTSLFSSSEAPPAAPPQAQPADVEPGAPPAAPSDTSEPPAKMAPPAANRQSAILPGGMSYMPSATGIVLPGEPARQAAPPRTADGAIPADRIVTGSVRAPSPAAAPAESTPLPPPAHAAVPTGADKLPAAIGGVGLRAAAVKGDPSAEFEIAIRFADGRQVPQDLTAAAEWFERAAKQGLVPALFRLGGLYEKGMGVKKDLDAARRLYSAAAQAGHGKAMHNLAVLYAEGIDGKPDYATAARWFRKAADYGVVDSQYNLAILYARGIGVETNLAEAFKWFTLAARDGDRDSAKKRDDVGARLDQPTLTAARAAAQTWTAQPQPEAAMQVKVPPAGWDAAPVPSTASRRVGADIRGPRVPQ